jgi:hypothetical protein
MPLIEFETMTPMFGLAKTVHALDPMATVINKTKKSLRQDKHFLS